MTIVEDTQEFLDNYLLSLDSFSKEMVNLMK